MPAAVVIIVTEMYNVAEIINIISRLTLNSNKLILIWPSKRIKQIYETQKASTTDSDIQHG